MKYRILLSLLLIVLGYQEIAGQQIINSVTHHTSNSFELSRQKVKTLHSVGVDTIIHFTRSHWYLGDFVNVFWQQNGKLFLQKTFTNEDQITLERLIALNATAPLVESDSMAIQELTNNEMIYKTIITEHGDSSSTFHTHDSRTWVTLYLNEQHMEYHINDEAIKEHDAEGRKNIMYKSNINSYRYKLIRKMECMLLNSGLCDTTELEVLTIRLNKFNCR